MKVYQLTPDGYFAGETNADPDPRNKDGWLIPGGCVLEQPPSFPDGKRAKWNKGTWTVEDIPTVDPVEDVQVEFVTAKALIDALVDEGVLDRSAVDRVKQKVRNPERKTAIRDEVVVSA